MYPQHMISCRNNISFVEIITKPIIRIYATQRAWRRPPLPAYKDSECSRNNRRIKKSMNRQRGCSCIVSTEAWAFPLPSSGGGACCSDIGFRHMSLVPMLSVRYWLYWCVPASAQLHARLTGDHKVAISTPAGSATFFRGDWSWNIFYCLPFPLIQEGRLSVSGEIMCTIPVNHLEDHAFLAHCCSHIA